MLMWHPLSRFGLSFNLNKRHNTLSPLIIKGMDRGLDCVNSFKASSKRIRSIEPGANDFYQLKKQHHRFIGNLW